VELTRSEVWNEIEKQLKKNGIEQLDYTSRRRSFTIDDIRAFIQRQTKSTSSSTTPSRCW
jgi:hypothetical protein